MIDERGKVRGVEQAVGDDWSNQTARGFVKEVVVRPWDIGIAGRRLDLKEGKEVEVTGGDDLRRHRTPND